MHAAALLLAAAVGGGSVTGAAPGPSWPEAMSLLRKLETVQRHRLLPRPRPRHTVTVTEGELNSYLNLALRADMPEGLSGVKVHMERERLEAHGTVDLERLRDKLVTVRSSLNPLALLSGQVPIYLRGRLRNQDGFGTIEWEEVRLSSMRIPVSLLEQLVSSSTRSRKYPEGWDIHAPFRLPYDARSIRLEPGRAVLDF